MKLRDRTKRALALGPTLPFPIGAPDPDSPAEAVADRLNRRTFNVQPLSAIDDLLAQALMSTKTVRHAHRMLILGRIAPAKQDNAVLLELCHLIRPLLRKDVIADDDTDFDDIWQFVIARDLVSVEYKDCFMHMIRRYWLFLRPQSPVRPTRDKYGSLPEAGVRAVADIEKDRYILELCGTLSRDRLKADMSKISVMQNKKGKRMYEALMAGPLRLVNHHCKPNSVMLRVLDHADDKTELPTIMLQSTRHIKAGEAITVNYGELYWEADWVCKCSSCDNDKPVPSRKLKPEEPSSVVNGPRLKKKRVRKRTQRPPVDSEAALALYHAQAGPSQPT